MGTDLGALLRASALGDENAFAQLYDAVSARIYGLVLRVVRDPARRGKGRELLWVLTSRAWQGLETLDGVAPLCAAAAAGMGSGPGRRPRAR